MYQHQLLETIFHDTKKARITICHRRKHKSLLSGIVVTYELERIFENKMAVVPLMLESQSVFMRPQNPASQCLRLFVVSVGYMQISLSRDHKNQSGNQ